MYKIDQDPGFLFGNVQIQPSKFEPLESGNDSVNINLSGSHSSSEQDGITIDLYHALLKQKSLHV